MMVESTQMDFKASTALKNCLIGNVAQTAHTARCFAATPRFSDPANFDYRLAPGSPGAGMATDGGDIGCRYTPEMLKMRDIVLELRGTGIIKF